MNDEQESMSRQEIMDGFSAVMNAFELFYQRLDDRITKEIGDLRSEMRAGFARVDRRLARLDDRVSVLEHDMSQVRSDVALLQSDMSRVKVHLGIAG